MEDWRSSFQTDLSKHGLTLFEYRLARLFHCGSLHAGHAQIHALPTTATHDALRAFDIVGFALGRLIPAAGNLSHQLILDRRSALPTQVIVFHAVLNNPRGIARASGCYG